MTTARIAREDAIRTLAERDLAALSADDRADLLGATASEDWSSDSAWPQLSEQVRAELEDGSHAREPNARRYDAVLLMPLERRYHGATNAFLAHALAEGTAPPPEVVGAEPQLAACPCCGYCTLDSRADFDICTVCWWEDDGQDNDTAADESGANGGLTLVAARVNFLRYGIYDPAREDLRAHQQPREMFVRGRVFELARDRVVEPSAGWSLEAGSDEQGG